MGQAETEAVQLVRSYVEALNSRDYETMTDHLADTVTMYDPAAPEGVVHGPDGVEAFLRETVDAFPDFAITILDVVAHDGTVMYEGEITMTHEGEFDGIPPTGETAEFREMTKWRVEDGEIRELRVYFDQQEVSAQLGLTDD